jgi:DNA-binding XRE family transcriptional regulator
MTSIFKMRMTNIATAIKSEISRIARREIRGETASLKKSAAAHRHEIAALKKRIATLERVAKRGAPRAERIKPNDDQGVRLRFRAGGFAANRKRLGLSAVEMGALVGASAQSVYAWESGKVRPRSSQLAAIAALRQLGKKEAHARLEEIQH